MSEDTRVTTIEVLGDGSVVVREDNGGSDLTYHDLTPAFIYAAQQANYNGTVRVLLAFDCHFDSRLNEDVVNWLTEEETP